MFFIVHFKVKISTQVFTTFIVFKAGICSLLTNSLGCVSFLAIPNAWHLSTQMFIELHVHHAVNAFSST